MDLFALINKASGQTDVQASKINVILAAAGPATVVSAMRLRNPEAEARRALLLAMRGLNPKPRDEDDGGEEGSED